MILDSETTSPQAMTVHNVFEPIEIDIGIIPSKFTTRVAVLVQNQSKDAGNIVGVETFSAYLKAQESRSAIDPQAIGAIVFEVGPLRNRTMHNLSRSATASVSIATPDVSAIIYSVSYTISPEMSVIPQSAYFRKIAYNEIKDGTFVCSIPRIYSIDRFSPSRQDPPVPVSCRIIHQTRVDDVMAYTVAYQLGPFHQIGINSVNMNAFFHDVPDPKTVFRLS